MFYFSSSYIVHIVHYVPVSLEIDLVRKKNSFLELQWYTIHTSTTIWVHEHEWWGTVKGFMFARLIRMSTQGDQGSTSGKQNMILRFDSCSIVMIHLLTHHNLKSVNGRIFTAISPSIFSLTYFNVNLYWIEMAGRVYKNHRDLLCYCWSNPTPCVWLIPVVHQALWATTTQTSSDLMNLRGKRRKEYKYTCDVQLTSVMK